MFFVPKGLFPKKWNKKYFLNPMMQNLRGGILDLENLYYHPIAEAFTRSYKRKLIYRIKGSAKG